MGNYKNKEKILEFVTKYNINADTYITRELVKKAREIIGYSKNTTGTDIRNSIANTIRKNV